jgi:hypothetical protein
VTVNCQPPANGFSLRSTHPAQRLLVRTLPQPRREPEGQTATGRPDKRRR